MLLNPDTVVSEDTFTACIEYSDKNSKLGGLGVPMYDGSGKYLPESKRGIPTPWASMCRITGLYRISPNYNNFNFFIY